MFIDLDRLPLRGEEGGFHVVVESPRGARVKLKYDPKLKAMTFSRPLVAGLHYPYDWGFIPGTCAPDGDPLDAMVFFDQATYPGVVIQCRALAVVRLTQNRKSRPGRESNDRIIAVPLKAPRFEQLKKLSDLSPRSRDEIEQFFLSATFFEAKNARVLRWEGPAAAEKLISLSAAQRSERPGGY